MVVKLVGQNSKKEYATGSKRACLRFLQSKYPTHSSQNIYGNRTYPEPLVIKTKGADGHA